MEIKLGTRKKLEKGCVGRIARSIFHQFSSTGIFHVSSGVRPQSILFSVESRSRKMMDILGESPGVFHRCVARPLNLFFPGMMIKRRRRLLNIYTKIPPESIETFPPFHSGRDQIIINKRIHLVILGYVSLQIYAPFVDLSSLSTNFFYHFR